MEESCQVLLGPYVSDGVIGPMLYLCCFIFFFRRQRNVPEAVDVVALADDDDFSFFVDFYVILRK